MKGKGSRTPAVTLLGFRGVFGAGRRGVAGEVELLVETTERITLPIAGRRRFAGASARSASGMTTTAGIVAVVLYRHNESAAISSGERNHAPQVRRRGASRLDQHLLTQSRANPAGSASTGSMRGTPAGRRTATCGPLKAGRSVRNL